MRRPARSTLFPYTGLFRSSSAAENDSSTAESSWPSEPGSLRRIASHVTIAASSPQLSTYRPTLSTSDRKSTRLNSSHANISYVVFCLQYNTNYLMHELAQC